MGARPCFAASGCASLQCWGERRFTLAPVLSEFHASCAVPSPRIGGGGEGADVAVA
ncbi:MAG: hypothetical protein UZ07_CHB004002735, partial [Chlorobi bacterium OLB7]